MNEKMRSKTTYVFVFTLNNILETEILERATEKRFNKNFKGFGILMTAILCFIDQRIASLLYFHYSKSLSLYKCCMAKFGCTTIIVILQIIFNRHCFLRKQPPLERPSYDIEMANHIPNGQTASQQSVLNSQTSNPPSRYRKKAVYRQPSSAFQIQSQSQTPSFNLRSSMKSTPVTRGTNLNVTDGKFNSTTNRHGFTNPDIHSPARDSESDVNLDAIARNYTV